MRKNIQTILRKGFGRQEGQLLIEAIVAMALVGIIITGLVTALTYSVNNTNVSKDQNLATSYAQEGLDIARNMKDSNSSTFFTLANGSYCVNSAASITSCVNCLTVTGTKYCRQIYVNQAGRNSSNTQICTNGTSSFVASIVTWTDNRCRNGAICHKAELDSCFSDPAKILY